MIIEFKNYCVIKKLTVPFEQSGNRATRGRRKNKPSKIHIARQPGLCKVTEIHEITQKNTMRGSRCLSAHCSIKFHK
jgi:hypothetical protein